MEAFGSDMLEGQSLVPVIDIVNELLGYFFGLEILKLSIYEYR